MNLMPELLRVGDALLKGMHPTLHFNRNFLWESCMDVRFNQNYVGPTGGWVVLDTPANINPHTSFGKGEFATIGTTVRTFIGQEGV